MPLRKIDDPEHDKWIKQQPCLHPEHNPPTMIVLEPGTYEHTCPGCGRTITFVVPPRPTWLG
jgi:hypothetical protein